MIQVGFMSAALRKTMARAGVPRLAVSCTANERSRSAGSSSSASFTDDQPVVAGQHVHERVEEGRLAHVGTAAHDDGPPQVQGAGQQAGFDAR